MISMTAAARETQAGKEGTHGKQHSMATRTHG